MMQMAPMTPGNIAPGVGEFEVEADHAYHHEYVGDIRVGYGVEYPVA